MRSATGIPGGQSGVLYAQPGKSGQRRYSHRRRDPERRQNVFGEILTQPRLKCPWATYMIVKFSP